VTHDTYAGPARERGAPPAEGVRAEPFPIAVVGIGCRFPGAHGPREFWRLLSSGGDAVGEVPPERFDAAVYRTALDQDGEPLLSSAAGGFLERADAFDAEFFGISPYEAARMDPQQRLFLETAWEAVEDAGLAPSELAGSRTGVYVAQLTTHYWEELYRAGVWDVHAMVGAEIRGNLPARLSHALDLRGPAVSVDASCASALLAVHLACQGLRLGELDAAVVGATNLVTNPEDGVVLSRGTLLSPTGRCRFGDAAADGFVRSEGIAAIVLKPLERALADGDRVYSVILGGAASNDGASNELFITPSEAGQREKLEAAYAAAGVAPRDVDYVEAHGAGTRVGDRTELAALGAVLGAGRGGRGRLLVGSVKSNIGHTESSSGLAGLIKVSLALWHGEIPATLHVRRPNPEVDWSGGGLRLARRHTPWPRPGRRALAGVNSFGISGANVHLVLSGAPPQAAAPVQPPTQNTYVLPLSARSAGALTALQHSYLSLLEAPNADRTLSDLCHTAAVRRAHHRYRYAAVGDNAAALAEQVRAEAAAGAAEAAGPTLDTPLVVYVFPGLGAQWTGMARDLLAQCPPFARALRVYDAAVQAEAGWSVLDLLASDDPLTDVGLAQPAVWVSGATEDDDVADARGGDGWRVKTP
jgi:acyl transferase domain-containing protein